jgi:hypothetical protein
MQEFVPCWVHELVPKKQLIIEDVTQHDTTQHKLDSLWNETTTISTRYKSEFTPTNYKLTRKVENFKKFILILNSVSSCYTWRSFLRRNRITSHDATQASRKRVMSTKRATFVHEIEATIAITYFNERAGMWDWSRHVACKNKSDKTRCLASVLLCWKAKKLPVTRNYHSYM